MGASLPPGFELVRKNSSALPPGFELVKRGASADPVDFSVTEMLSNIPKSAYNYGAGIAGAVAHPVRTAQAIGGLAQSLGNKIGRTAAELVQGQEMEPMPEHSEALADATGQAIKGRYGSVDAIKNTAMQDPVGMLSDVSGLLMATKLPGIARMAAAVEPINAIGKTAQAVAKVAIPEGKASKMYQSVAKFGTTLTAEERADMIKTALDQGIMPTSKGVIKVQDRIDILNSQLDDLIANATTSGQKVPVNTVFQYLSELRKSKGGAKIEAGSDLAKIQKISQQFYDNMKGRYSLTPEELQAFKVDIYKKVNYKAKQGRGSQVKEDTYKTMGRWAKDEMVNAVPEAADINRELSSLYNLQPELSRAAGRIGNHNDISINTPLNVGAGGIIGEALGSGGAGLVAGAITTIFGNPKIKARVAIAQNKIKQGDIKWLEANQGAAEVRIAMSLSGRLEEQLNGQQANQ